MTDTTCSTDGCDGVIRYKQLRLCHACYRRLKRWGDVHGGGPRQRKDRASGCLVVEDDKVCGLPCVGQDMCRMHYMRNVRNGDPLVAKPKGGPPQAITPERQCTKCGETKPTDEFPWRVQRKGRRIRHAWCALCLAAYYREHGKANADRKAEQGQRYRYRKLKNWVEDVDRAERFMRDGGLCGICGLAADPDDWHLDHVRPVSKGGEHSYANTQVSHPLCNKVKRDRLLPLPDAAILTLRVAQQALAA